jgi:hypothetical protein
MKVLIVVVLLVVPTFARRSEAATPEQIEKALAAGREALFRDQKNGHWEKVDKATGPGGSGRDGQDTESSQFTGRTALATYALLASGVPASDPRIKSAVEFLLKNETRGVYALGMRCQVWLNLRPSPEIRAAMQKDSALLRTSMKTEGNSRGMYDYIPGKGGGKSYSHSRAQYAVLGVWAAAQSGIEVPDAYWKTVDEAWRRNQATDGGWTYKHPADETEHATTVGMTAVGVATLLTTQDYLSAGEGVACRPGADNKAIEKGLKWIAANTDKFAMDTRYPRDYPYTTLYAIERIGVASGLSYFGNVNWFVKGADWIVREQRRDGSWGYGLTDTCFAMLFLATSSGNEVVWNQRPRDVANVVQWIGRTLERDLAY